MLFPVLAIAVAVVPVSVKAQSAMSHDAMASPALAAYACRQTTANDSSSMMSQNHEILATTADGAKLVCMSLAGMHDKMMAEMAKAAKAKDPAAASQAWYDYTSRALAVPF
jgi:hypothetical protein